MTPHVDNNTAMKAAFGRRGIKQEDVELDLALARYLNVTDGDVARLQERVRLAIEKLPGKGHANIASDGQRMHARPRQPVEGDAGQLEGAEIGHDFSARSSSSNRDGGGHPLRSREGLVSATSAREPSPEQREASLKVRTASAKVALTVFDRNKTSAGEVWGNVCAHELAGMNRDGVMAKALSDYLGPLEGATRFKPIRELMSPSQFEEVLGRVRGQNHAA